MAPKFIPKQRRGLSLEEKIQLLDHYKETKCSIRKLAKYFNIGKTQAGVIIKQEPILYERWLSGNSGQASKHQSNVAYDIDKKIYDWYLEKTKDNGNITGQSLQSKALELARDLGFDSFKASNGWLAKFVKRHSISFKELKNDQIKTKITKEIDHLFTNFDEWSKILSPIIDKYSEDKIFSAVPTGLFFRSPPEDTFLLEKACVGGTHSAERFTVLFCASMSGKKEKPLVIADISDKEIENLNLVEVDCKANRFSWLNKNIMHQWLTDLNTRMAVEKKKIVLFLDHSLPRHDSNLSNIRTIYFPNVSCNNQRINQGIIQNFKVIYRSQMLKHLIAIKEKDFNDSLSDHIISVSEALTWIIFSWKNLSENVIHKCFEEFFFNATSDSVCDEDASVTLNDISDLLCAYDSFINATDYLSIDDCLVMVGEDSEPIEIIVDGGGDISESTDAENLDESENVISNNNISNFYCDSLKTLKQFEKFYQSQNDSNGALLVKQLITHHESIINSKDMHCES